MCVQTEYMCRKFLSKDLTEKMHASSESTEVDDTVETVRGLSKSPPSHRGTDLIISPLAELLILFFYIIFIGKTIINATLMI